MANNTTATCLLDGNTQNLTDQLAFAAYTAVTPIYFIIGLISHFICLMVFYRQYKTETAYAYQIYASLIQIIGVIVIALCMITKNNLSGYRSPGASWYQKNYVLMWYAARLASPLEQGFITTSLLISLSMSADRLFALSKPFVYKNINHSRHQISAVVLCLGIGLLTSLFDVFRYQVCLKGDHYVICVNESYVATTSAITLAIFRNIVRIITNIALVICNIAMVICYRRSTNKVASLSKGNEQRAARRKSIQKTLFVLTVCQSIFVTTNLTMFNIYYSLVYSQPTFTNCFGKLMAPMDDLTLQITGILEIFILITIFKQLREKIFDCLKCKKNIELFTKAADPIAEGNV